MVPRLLSVIDFILAATDIDTKPFYFIYLSFSISFCGGGVGGQRGQDWVKRGVGGGGVTESSCKGGQNPFIEKNIGSSEGKLEFDAGRIKW